MREARKNKMHMQQQNEKHRAAVLAKVAAGLGVRDQRVVAAETAQALKVSEADRIAQAALNCSAAYNAYRTFVIGSSGSVWAGKTVAQLIAAGAIGKQGGAVSHEVNEDLHVDASLE